MKLLGGWLEGVVVEFPCLFWGGRMGRGVSQGLFPLTQKLCGE